jgi:DNA topoisomerase-1
MPPPVESARRAGLRYISDDAPGLTRRRRGDGWVYLDPRGRIVRDPDTRARIDALAIPPAWTNVWICPDARGHLQATGRDARNRKQHRYHARFREWREQNKFDRVIAFARALPRIRAAAHRHLQRRGLPRQKVLAAIVLLLEKTLIRIGNEQYAQNNNHFGLTTLRDRHVRIRANTARFRFTGKSGAVRAVELHDPRLVRIIRQCQELPGQELLQYVDDRGAVRDVTSTDVNEYLRQIAGEDFTAKDFRTWAATVLAATTLRRFGEPARTLAQQKKNLLAAVESVARRLGNSRTVCRKCYIHPAVLNAYLDRDTLHTLGQSAGGLRHSVRLSDDERAVLDFLEQTARRAQSGHR